jgi:hypothetical protein
VNLDKPSDGLEPSTPSLPWKLAGNRWQPGATDLACFRGFRRRGICHRLPLVAPAGLHKGSILCSALLRENSRVSGTFAGPSDGLEPSTPPYHALVAATGRNRRQRLWLDFPTFGRERFATGCHRLQPRRCIRLQLVLSVVATPAAATRRAASWGRASRVDTLLCRATRRSGQSRGEWRTISAFMSTRGDSAKAGLCGPSEVPRG